MLIPFTYTNNKHKETEIKNTVPFTLTTKKMKYLGIILEKHIQDLYPENYKMLMKKSKKN